MKNETGEFTRSTPRPLGALLMLCACMLVANVSAFGQTEKHETQEVPDGSYGAGGTKRTYTSIGPYSKVVQVDVRDPQGVLREHTSTSTGVGKVSSETVIFYDCNGKMSYYERTGTDFQGNKDDFVLERFEDGKKISGIRRYTDANGK